MKISAGLIAALLLTALAARPVGADATFDKVRDINALLPCDEISPAGWTVVELALGAQRQVDHREMPAGRIFRVEGTYYVSQKDSPRWLVGRQYADAKGPRSEIRCEQAFATLDELLSAAAFAPLPKAPEGFTVREVGRFPYPPTRLASDSKGESLFALCGSGDVWRIDLKTGVNKQVLRSTDYIDPARGDSMVVGMTLDAQNRLYIVGNQRASQSFPITNEVTIYRTTTVVDGLPAAPKAWLRAYYPWGIGPFNHCVGHIATGPDGMLYVSSGSRTDGGEPGNDDRYWKGGEHELTSCIWRLDPNEKEPKIAFHARGLRNPYGFCWDAAGRMFATDNGPDAEPAEELNFIEAGKHYGFPYKFSDWTRKPYPYTPDPPAGLEFKLPIANRGPDGGYDKSKGQPISTFDPHSSPSGIVALGDDFPERYRGTLLVARFGNLIKRDKDVGFDVLAVRLDPGDGPPKSATMETFLSPLSRPIDLHLGGKGKLYVCEYSRQLRNEGYAALLPGRVLEIAVK